MAYTNAEANPGTGGPKFNVDQNTGVDTPVTKIAWGVESTITPVTAAAPLPVVQTGTSALPTGASTLAEQQTQTASLSVMDDWDESDRAKVNLIVGQAGVTAGAGAVAANTPRMTLASDDPAVAAINATALPVGAGTAAAAGRVTLASDDPAVAALQIIDNIVSGAGANITQFAGVNNATGSGNATGALRVELPTNGTGVIATVGAVTAITNALPAGTNAIGKLAANDGVDIGNVDVASLPAALSASATFTPAAASHVANDCNGAAGTFALSAISASRVMITDATLEIDGATAEATAWRLYLYNVTPPSAIADDGAWDLASGDRASWLGYLELGTAADLGSTQWVQNSAINRIIKLAGTSVFGYLVNLTTLTPANVAHIVTVTAVQF